MDHQDPRIAREIAVFAGQGRLHSGNPAMAWRNNHVVAPMARSAFGSAGVHTFYAQRIREAIVRTGQNTVVSIGCGSGHEEIETLRRADELGLPPFAITGLELSPVTAERANRLAEDVGLSDRFSVIVHNLNAGLPNLPPVAAVMAHHMLHHVDALETLYASLRALLDPEGSLLTWDMIGRNGHQRWPETAPLVRSIWQTLPIAQRYDHMMDRSMLHWQDWDCAIEGFEGIRAQEVLPLLTEHFVPFSFIAWGGLLDAFVNDRTGPSFDPVAKESDRKFLERVAALEEALLARRATTPSEMGAEFRSVDSGFKPDPKVIHALNRAIRRAGETFPVAPLEEFHSLWPKKLPITNLGHETLAEAGAFEDGWGDDGWAILSEQGLDLWFEKPVAELNISVWHNLPANRAQVISIFLDGANIVDSIRVASEDLVTFCIYHPTGEALRWRLRISSSNYRQPDEDGGQDRRPLAWRLVQISPKAASQKHDFLQSVTGDIV